MGQKVSDVHVIITNHRDDIVALCERLGVRRLDVFGSATTPSFEWSCRVRRAREGIPAIPSPPTRIRLGTRSWDEPAVDDSVESYTAWLRDIEQRLDALVSGEDPGEDCDDVHKDLVADYDVGGTHRSGLPAASGSRSERRPGYWDSARSTRPSAQRPEAGR